MSVGQARYVVETCNDAGVHVSSTAEGVEITVPPTCLNERKEHPGNGYASVRFKIFYFS